MPPSLRRPLVLVVGLLLVVAAVVVGVRLATGDDDEGRPVLLVYGYQGTTEQMEPLADALRAAGRNVTIVDLPDDNTGDLWDSAWRLGQAAEQAMADADADSVDVVAHSAGGIVTRLWVSTAGADVAHRVVTLGSPHHGSDGAAVFDECLEACQQLTPGSDLLDELAQQDETPGAASWVSIWSANDGAVEPPESSELDGAVNLRLQDVCPGAEINHSQLLSDPLPLALAVAEVDADEPVEYGSGDCEQLSGS
ncbi:lipase family alpha/beta hydrolase [Geodermatophilus normandii]|uniref:lipase family alpha/beta hydrolase n=1 Tax=Geodermatophilus normandii TaxID=1137989 RepID=UPI0031F32777